MQQSNLKTKKGVYVIKHKDHPNVIYIGSTARSFGLRWGQHKSGLNRKAHDNPYLQSIFNKYGAEGLQFKILEIIEDAKLILAKEQEWLDKLSKDYKLFNSSSKVTASMFGRKHTSEAIAKIVARHKGRKLSEEAKRKIGNGNRIALTGKKLSLQTRQKMSNAQKGKTFTKEHLEKIGAANSKQYPSFIHRETKQIIPSGFNYHKLAKELNVDYRLLWMVAKGKRKSHRNWILCKET